MMFRARPRRLHRFRSPGRRRRAAVRRPALRRLTPALLAVVAAATVLTVGGSSQTRTSADLSQFDPANIISDQVFFFGAGMTAPQVQAFLDDKNGGCVPGSDGTPCLRTFRQDTTDRPADGYCGGYVGAPGETAAVIIAKTAASCNINPKVLLVMLQKEQSLVTASGGNLFASRYRSAMGYGCPDTAACDSLYYGFQNQLYSAARQFQRYAATPSNWAYRAGRTSNILWHPNTACGSAPVAVANQATANLYIYTPYQPNGAALRAGYGSGDGCSSYGNRNFWLYFTDWFGSTQSDTVAKSSPRGVVDNLSLTPSGFSSWGWAFDPDTDAPVTVRATVDGGLVGTVTANASRPDVATALGVGPNHGYGITGLLSYGTHQVCISADNASGPGITVQLGCQTVTFSNPGPLAALDHFAEQPDGSVTIDGWAFDPDGTPTAIHVYADGKPTVHQTGNPRPDVQTAYPAAGPNSGFSMTLPAVPANSKICVYSVDTVAIGNNWLMGCRTFPYQGPVGWVDAVSENATGQVDVSGWTLDPSLPLSPIDVHLYLDGRFVTAAQASSGRDDVGRAYPGTGSAHGFGVTIPAGQGQHQVCVYAINVGIAGTNPPLGCRNLTLQYAAPSGWVDAVTSTGGGRIAVAGWAWDPSLPTAPTQVHVYVDGRFAGVSLAADPRPDVAAVLPAAGAGHGFSASFAVAEGRHEVCTYAINVGVPGPNPSIGCRTVDVVDLAPIGSVDSIAASGPGQVTLWGWTFDPDTPTTPVSVRVLVDGADRGLLTAGDSRPDIGAAFPAAGAAHGFGTSLGVSAGQHDVCVSALSTADQRKAVTLRCARVTV